MRKEQKLFRRVWEFPVIRKLLVAGRQGGQVAVEKASVSCGCCFDPQVYVIEIIHDLS